MNRSLVQIQRTAIAIRWIVALAAWLVLPVGASLGEELDRPVVASQSEGPQTASSDRAAAIAQALRQAHGATDEMEVAAHLESLRAMGKKASSVAEAVADLLNESSPLYRDRDKHEVMRLRAYVFVVLSEIGIPQSALTQIVDALANSDDEMGYHFAAAARAAGTLGPQARPLVPHLCAGMQRFYHRDEFSLQRYDPDYPQEEATTVQSEAITALAKISAPSDPAVIELLTSYANGEHPDTQRFPMLIKHADRSLRLMRSRVSSHAADTSGRRAGGDSVAEANNRSPK